MSNVTLNPDAVKDAILTAEGETPAVVAVFKMVYPNWNNIAEVNGHPVCNEVTWKRICGWCQELGTRLNKARAYDKQVMLGGAWLNYGFSVHDPRSKTLRDWQVIPAPVTCKTESV